MEIEWYEWTTQMYKQGKPGNILYSAVGGGESFYKSHNILTPPTTTTASFTNHKVLCIKGMAVEWYEWTTQMYKQG